MWRSLFAAGLLLGGLGLLATHVQAPADLPHAVGQAPPAEMGPALPSTAENSHQASEPTPDPWPAEPALRAFRHAGPIALVAAQEDAAPQLSPEMAALRDKLHKTLDAYYGRKLNTAERGAWAIMHAIIAYGVDTTVRRGGSDGPEVNAVGWLCYNGACAGQKIMYLNTDGRIVGAQGAGVQGHPGQFLAILAQSRVRLDTPVLVQGKKLTLADLVESEKLGCEVDTELTFKLIGLMHYLGSDEKWKNHFGQEWSIERLIHEELKLSVHNGACGGTHRMMGFSYAVQKRKKRGEPMTGEFARAEKFVGDYHRYTFSLQNADGSFSTEWFRRRGDSSDLDRRIQTTGHILEWLAFSLSDQELLDPRTVKAARYLTDLLNDNQGRNWEVGTLGHALHALVLYEQRVFKTWRAPAAANGSSAAGG